MAHQRLKNSTVDIICIARQTSTRFPNKIFADIDGRPMLTIIIEKLKDTKANIVFAIPDNRQNDELDAYLSAYPFPIYRGSEDNVLERFSCATELSDAEYVQRFNCDNLLFDSGYMASTHDIVKQNPDMDLFSNTHCPNHSGQSIQIVKKSHCLQIREPDAHEQEHVFPYFCRICETQFKLPCPIEQSFPIDELSDLEKMKAEKYKL